MLENLSVLDPKKRNNPNKGKHKATLEREASKSEKNKKLKMRFLINQIRKKLKKILILVRE